MRTNVDVLVIGSGPGGMSSAQYSSRAGHNTMLIDPNGQGGQLLFIDRIENYPGFENINGYLLSSYMEKQCESFGVSFDMQKAKKIEKKDNSFFVETDEGEIKAKAVIIATGATHKKLGVKGEEEYFAKGVSYCATCDGPFFKDKRVVVVGGGDTALTDADFLSSMCKEVTIIHRRDSFRAQQALVDRVKEKANISFAMNDTVKEIKGNGEEVTSVLLESGKEIETDGVFIFVGITPSSSIVEKLCELENGFIKVNENKETTLSGLFACGDVTTTPFRQVVTAASDGAIASHSADEYISSHSFTS